MMKSEIELTPEIFEKLGIKYVKDDIAEDDCVVIKDYIFQRERNGKNQRYVWKYVYGESICFSNLGELAQVYRVLNNWQELDTSNIKMFEYSAIAKEIFLLFKIVPVRVSLNVGETVSDQGEFSILWETEIEPSPVRITATSEFGVALGLDCTIAEGATSIFSLKRLIYPIGVNHGD